MIILEKATGKKMTTAISNATKAIKEALSAWSLPGVVIGITDRQSMRVVITHGFSDLKARVPLMEQGRFAIGSVSKSFTALAVLQLADEGRLSLQAPIARYLPGLSLVSRFEPISVHHLLSHTSGLPLCLVHAYSSRYVMSALRDVVPGYAPGEHGYYSNTGYQLLGYLIENLDGVSYASSIQRRILDPLGMRSSAAIIDNAERPAMVTSYVRWPDGTFFEELWYEYAAADGSLISSIADMGAYARCILNRGVCPSGRLLSESAFENWITPATPEGHAYGLFVSRGERDIRIVHGGGIMGFHSELDVHLDAGFAMVILSNSPFPSELKVWIADTVSKGFMEESPTAAPMQRTPVEVEDYVGVYRLRSTGEDACGTVECVVHEGRLCLRQGRELKQLECMGGDCFRVVGPHSDGFPFFFARANADTGRRAQEYRPFGGTRDASPEEDKRVTDVSHGAKWYVREDLLEPNVLPTPQDYAAFVGHFENFCPEGPVMRVFVRNGQLWGMTWLSEKAKPTLLEPIGPSTFRFGKEGPNPERVQFDTIIDGRARRMMWSGMPVYRRDTH